MFAQLAATEVKHFAASSTHFLRPPPKLQWKKKKLALPFVFPDAAAAAAAKRRRSTGSHTHNSTYTHAPTWGMMRGWFMFTFSFYGFSIAFPGHSPPYQHTNATPQNKRLKELHTNTQVHTHAR